MSSGRVYVGGMLVGLIDFDDVSKIKLSAQCICNAYPNEPTLLQLDSNRKQLIHPSTTAERFNFDLQRKPKTVETTIQRKPR